MASGEAEPLQYTTTVLRVSIHCEGCKKKVKKVLHSIEGVYKVTVDAAQHKVTVTSSVGADALIRRLNKAGKLATLWPAASAPVAVAEDKKAEAVTAAPPDVGEVCKDGGDKADAKPKEAAAAKKTKQAETEEVEKKKREEVKKKPEKESGCDKKPEKDKQGGPDKAPGKADAAKQRDGVAPEAKEKKGSPAAPAKDAAATPAEEASIGEEGSSPKKGNKNKKKTKPPKDSGGGGAEGDAAAEKPPPPVTAVPASLPPPSQFHHHGPDQRPLGGGFPPYYAPPPVMSYNVAHPIASVSYYAPAPAPSAHVPYGYPPGPMLPPPVPEYMYGPPGMRASPPRESYNNLFHEENANSCSLM